MGGSSGAAVVGWSALTTSGVQHFGNPIGAQDFTWAIASGDFNDDGFDDVVTGLPSDGDQPSGAILIQAGGQGGLNAVMTPLFQGSTGIPGDPEPGDELGKALATGDFNGDGFSDIAVGVPGEDIKVNPGFGIPSYIVSDAGAVIVIFGPLSSPPTAVMFHRNSRGIPGDLQEDERCGSALAAGNFNADGTSDDLALIDAFLNPLEVDHGGTVSA